MVSKTGDERQREYYANNQGPTGTRYPPVTWDFFDTWTRPIQFWKSSGISGTRNTGFTRNIGYTRTWKIEKVHGNTQKCPKYPKINKIPGNTRLNISTPLPDPNPTCYPVFCPIPNPTRFSFENHRVAGNPKYRVLPDISGKPEVSGITQYFGYSQTPMFPNTTIF